MDTEGAFTCLQCRFAHNHVGRLNPAPPTNRQPELQCMLLNVRSLGKHAIEIWDTSTNPDVVFHTETWLKES